MLLRCPDEKKKNVVACSDTECVGELINYFENCADKIDSLYLIGEINTELETIVQNSIRSEEITMIEKSLLIESDNLQDYFKCFDECWTTEDCGDEVSLMCGLFAIDTFHVKGGSKAHVEAIVSDGRQYETLCKERVNEMVFYSVK